MGKLKPVKKGSLSQQKKGSAAKSISKKNIENELKEEIQSIKNKILSSKTELNLILKLMEYTQSEQEEVVYLGIKSMQQVISNLIKKNDIVLYKAEKGVTKDVVDFQVQEWLSNVYKKWIKRLLNILGNKEPVLQVAALEAIIQMIKEDNLQGFEITKEYNFNTILMEQLTNVIVHQVHSEQVLNYFLEKFVNVYHDLQYYFCKFLSKELRDKNSTDIEWYYQMLFSIRNVPKDKQELKYFGLDPKSIKSDDKHLLIKINNFKKEYQEAWLSFLLLPLSNNIIKKVLLVMHHRLLPNFLHPLKMMDFLTLAYDFGGSISLLSLNGLFTLIHKYNMDYPMFYNKLYKLFNKDLLHSKYRSRFFRLSEMFLNSGYLPVNLIAAFIKKMSRLAMFAPPGAIVMVLPFIYNLLKMHPQCMQLIHRTGEVDHMDVDPFDFNCNEPTDSKALESSIWEIQSLLRHYYPNVSSLTQMFKEQFTKPNYILEHFLDHNFNSMINVELDKPFKKVPALNENVNNTMFINQDLDKINLQLSNEWLF